MEEQKHYVFEEGKRMTLAELLMQFGLKGGDRTVIIVEKDHSERETCRRSLESTPNGRRLLYTKVTAVTIPYLIPKTDVKTIKFIL